MFYPEPYCPFVKKAPSICYEESVLELWASEGVLEEAAFFNISLDSVLETINTKNTSGLFMIDKDFKDYLGGIKYNSTGHIIGAGVATFTIVNKVNRTALDLLGSVQRGELVDQVFLFQMCSRM